MIKQITGHDRQKLLFLSFAACLIAASYAIFRPLKIAIFFRLVGKEYYPLGKIALILFVVPCMALYAKLVDKLKKQHVLYFLFTVYCLLGFLFAYLLAHPVYGLTNTDVNPYRSLGWFFLAAMDLFPAFVLGVFWAFVNSTCTPSFAQHGYGFIVAFTKIGGIIAAGASYLFTNGFLGSTISIPTFIGIGSILLLASLIFIAQIIRVIPATNLAGYQKLTQKNITPSATFGSIEGLKFMLTTPYVFGLFLMFYFYEVIFTIVEYQATVHLSFATHNNALQMSSALFLCAFISQVLGLFLALLGPAITLKYLSMRFALMIMPLTTIFFLFLLLLYPSLYMMLSMLILFPTINFSLNAPIREMLFIPTIKEIQFKSKAWIDSFGRTLSKTSGSTANLLFVTSSSPAFLFCNTTLSFLLAVTWTIISYFLGKSYTKTIETKKIIGGEKSL